MSFSKIKTQGQSQGHVISAFMRYFFLKKTNKNITSQHGLLDLVYRCVYIYKRNVYTVNYIYKQIDIKQFFGTNFVQLYRNEFSY